MLTTIPPTLHSPGGRRTPAPGSPQHTLAVAAAAPAAPAATPAATASASASLPRRPVSRRLCAAAGATSSRAAPHARRRYAVAVVHRPDGLAALRPFAPRRGPRTPPPSPPAGNAGHAASRTQLAKALLHRALGAATSQDDLGTRDPAACTRRGAVPSRPAGASRA